MRKMDYYSDKESIFSSVKRNKSLSSKLNLKKGNYLFLLVNCNVVLPQSTKKNEMSFINSDYADISMKKIKMNLFISKDKFKNRDNSFNLLNSNKANLNSRLLTQSNLFTEESVKSTFIQNKENKCKNIIYTVAIFNQKLNSQNDQIYSIINKKSNILINRNKDVKNFYLKKNNNASSVNSFENSNFLSNS